MNKIDVIVPVYNGLDLVKNCLESLRADSCKVPYELIVIDDASPDPAVWPYLQKCTQLFQFTLLRNSANLGFTGTVNRGMALHADRDVVLLNSDTQVYNDWLDRLVTAAYRNDRIASVNPMTNSNGSHVSYYPAQGMGVGQIEVDDATLDVIAAEVNDELNAYPHAIVGFCMLIKRAALDDVGLFDIENFPIGYGEETDFCFRALRLGWCHAVTGDTFVSHFEGKSFGDRKQRLMTDMFGRFQRLHPDAIKKDRSFVAEDPLRPLRLRMDLGRLKRLLDGCRSLRAIIIDDDIRGGAYGEVLSLQFDRRTSTFKLVPHNPGAFPNLQSYVMPHQLDLLNEALRLLGIEELLVTSEIEKLAIQKAVKGLPFESELNPFIRISEAWR